MNEILFNKVFKNVYLFKQITSNFECKGISKFRYDEIIHVTWMLQFGYTELLRYKIKSFHPIVFEPHTIQSTSKENNDISNTFTKLFETINGKDKTMVDQDYQFYSNLFSQHYNKTMEFNFNYLIKLSTKLNCLIALKVILEQHSMYSQISQSNLISTLFPNSISTYSLKFVKYIIELMDNQLPPLKKSILTINELNKLFNDNIKSYGYKKFKIINYLIQLKLNNVFIISRDSVYYNYINQCDLFIGYKDPIQNGFKLNDLIEANKLGVQFQLISINIQKCLNSFSIYQLKSPLKQLLLSLDDNPIQIEQFKQLLNGYVSITKQPILSNYLKYYNDNQKMKNFLLSNLPTHKTLSVYISKCYRQSLKYGDYSLIESNKQFTIDSHKECVYGLYQRKEYPNLLFKYCNDRDKQIEFIKKVIQIEIMIPISLITSLIGYGDIQLIEIALNQYSPEILDQFLKFELSYKTKKVPTHHSYGGFAGYKYEPSDIIEYPNFTIPRAIKTIEMLDYCYSRFKQHFKPEIIVCWYELCRIDLIKRYKELVDNDNNAMVSKPLKLVPLDEKFLQSYISISSNGKFIKTMTWMISCNQFIWNGDHSDIFNILRNCKNKQLYIPEIRYIIANTRYPFSTFVLSSNITIPSYSNIIQWIGKYHLNDTIGKNARITINHDELLYELGQLVEIVDYFKSNISNFPLKSLTSLLTFTINETSRLGKLNSLDKIIDTFKGIDNDDEKSIKSLLINAATFGRLNIFIHLFENHNAYLFNVLLDKEFQCTLLKITIQQCNLILFNYFLNVLSFSNSPTITLNQSIENLLKNQDNSPILFKSFKNKLNL